MEALKVGDIVRLKSGGPNMTVSVVNEPGAIHCQWFNQEKDGLSFKAELAVFKADMLDRV